MRGGGGGVEGVKKLPVVKLVPFTILYRHYNRQETDAIPQLDLRHWQYVTYYLDTKKDENQLRLFSSDSSDYCFPVILIYCLIL